MPRPAYQFVDNIRCIAMIAIVTEHTSFLGSYVYNPESSPYWAYLTSIQLVKFGTIAFFIIAGFLFNDNSGRYDVLEYVKRRFDNIFKPWLIWSLAFLFILTIGTAAKAIITKEPIHMIIAGIWWGVKTVYLHSNYWFIMNFFFCTTVLLLSKSIIRSWWFGAALFLMTSFYSVNVYTEWIMPQHTTAIFGFVFFYWLGVQLNIHYEKLELLINKTSSKWFILVTAMALFFAVQEASYLHTLKRVDPINTLRVTNVIFSIAVFALFLKVKNFNWLGFLQPRKTTYGIFLIHYILVFSALPLFMGVYDFKIVQKFSIAEMYQYQCTRFLIVYILSFLIVQTLNKSNYSWIIGTKTSKVPVTNTEEHQLAPQGASIAA